MRARPKEEARVPGPGRDARPGPGRDARRLGL